MPKVRANQCQRILPDGTRCTTTTDNEMCYRHTSRKYAIRNQCKQEGCETNTYSKYGYCSLHSQKELQKNWIKKYREPQAEANVI